MLTPRKISAVLEQGKGASNAGPLALHPLPRWEGPFSERKATGHRCTDFQDHLVLETLPDFRIILGLENATAVPHLGGDVKKFTLIVASSDGGNLARKRGSATRPASRAQSRNTGNRRRPRSVLRVTGNRSFIELYDFGVD
jgi:hypothetical protein